MNLHEFITCMYVRNKLMTYRHTNSQDLIIEHEKV